MVSGQESINQSVTFTREATDQTLMAAVEKELAKKKYNSFSDLCKQALRQFFLLSYTPPTSRVGQTEQQLIELHLKFTELEQKLLARGTRQLEEVENQLQQLTQPASTEQMERQLTELDRKFAELEQKLLARDTTQLEQLEQLCQLTQPANTGQMERQLTELDRKFAELEQRLLTRDTTQLEQIEKQLHQLTQQLQHRESPYQQTLPEPEYQQILSEPEYQQTSLPEAIAPTRTREIDPLLSRLSPLFEDF